MIAEKTFKILKEDNIKPKKMFGQNFLTDKNVLLDIIKASNVTSEDYVIEIGPGLGSLTELLCKNCKKVLCYEIDNDLAKLLPERLKDYNNFEIINEDFLKRNISDDITEKFGKEVKVKVVANIPYNITTPIMFALLKEIRIDIIVLMVQKELVERFCSKPSNKEYGSISAYLSYCGENKIIRIVNRSCFEPVPNVDSAVYRFIRTKNQSEEEFLDFLRKAFQQKRKKLTNNIENIYGKQKQEIIDNIIKIGYDENIRAEAISATKLHELFELLKGEIK